MGIPSRLKGCQTRLRSCGLDRNCTALRAWAMGIYSLDTETAGNRPTPDALSYNRAYVRGQQSFMHP